MIKKFCGTGYCDEWKAKHELRMSLILEAQASGAYFGNCECELAVMKDFKEVEEAVQRWVEVNFRSVQAYYNKSKFKGHSATTKDLKILVFGCAGRLLITIQDKRGVGEGRYDGAWITIIGPDLPHEKARPGVQGLAARKEEALALLRDTMKLPALSVDKGVSII